MSSRKQKSVCHKVEGENNFTEIFIKITVTQTKKTKKTGIKITTVGRRDM